MSTSKLNRLRVVCAWCKKIIEIIETEDVNCGISHGICEDCREEFLPSKGISG